MSANWTKRFIGAALLAAIASGLAWFAWPRPVLVDLATLAKGPIEVTADDDGKTHVRHVYTVSAPIAGKVLRISHPLGEQGPSLHVGDEVSANQTVVALMQPTLPGFIDVRSRDQLQAEVLAADAAIQQQEAEVKRIEAALDFSRTEFQRAQTLLRTQSTSAQAFDKAKFEVATNEAALASAKAQIEMRRAVRTSLAARLMDPANAAPSAEPMCCVRVLAPASGRVLKIIQDSEATVLPGTSLIDIGNPLDLEVVADLLSIDAVQIKVGAPVRIDGWGGQPIRGQGGPCRPRRLPEGFGAGYRGTAGPGHHRFQRPARELGLAWPRLPRRCACDDMERPGRPVRAGKRFVPERRSVGRFCRPERPGPDDSRPDRPPQQPPRGGSLGSRCRRPRRAASK
ncbi:multidrug efflux pump subunit AcrA (membrane-fusion protein) [Bradyrhizobium ottawaense]